MVRHEGHAWRDEVSAGRHHEHDGQAVRGAHPPGGEAGQTGQHAQQAEAQRGHDENDHGHGIHLYLVDDHLVAVALPPALRRQWLDPPILSSARLGEIRHLVNVKIR
ncbi:hypothetical protein ACIBF6_10060 [Streptosporangium amethystogenes]|uniref:hypothetical protein n=1 Tax=Streptosporangium amethystogenes TaxID=2002 RepID=UPI00379AB0A4